MGTRSMEVGSEIVIRREVMKICEAWNTNESTASTFVIAFRLPGNNTYLVPRVDKVRQKNWKQRGTRVQTAIPGGVANLEQCSSERGNEGKRVISSNKLTASVTLQVSRNFQQEA